MSVFSVTRQRRGFPVLPFSWSVAGLVLALLAALTVYAPVAAVAAVASPVAAVAVEPGVEPVPGTPGVSHDEQVAQAKESGESVELTDLRTEGSETVVRPDGRLETRAFTEPVHYEAPDGTWQAIDTTLVADTTGRSAWKSTAGAHTVWFPADLASGTIGITKGSLDIEISGPGTTPSVGFVDGDTITYAEVLPGVDAVYRVTNRGLKEAFVLAGPAGASSFTASISATPGATLRSDEAGFVFSHGADELRIEKPFAVTADPLDVSGRVDRVVGFAVIPSGNGWQAVTTVDPSWLNDPARQYPVVIDPTFTDTGTTALADCDLVEVFPTTTVCSNVDAPVGVDSYATARRFVLKPDITALPLDATVVRADLSLYTLALVGGSSFSVEAHQVSSAWTAGQATWNNRIQSSSTAWTTAGGDFLAAETTKTVTAAGGTWAFPVTGMTQAWASQPAKTAFGIEIKLADDTGATMAYVNFAASGNATSARRPALVVQWTPRVGAQSFEKLWSQPLSDRSDINVNLATGNLMVHSSDISQRSVGVPLSVDRFYNSRSAYAGSTGTAGYSIHRLGAGWATTLADDVWLDPEGTDHTTYLLHGPTGEEIVFRDPTLSGTWTAPNATMTRVAGGSSYFYVKFLRTGVTYKFIDSGTFGAAILVEATDRNGHGLTIATGTYFAATSVTDEFGVVATYNTTGGYLSSISLSTSPSRTYSYGLDATSHKLTSFTDPIAGTATSYSYNATSGLLEYIDTPRSSGVSYRTKFTYDATGRVTEVRRYASSGTSTSGSDLITGFAYTAPTSTVGAKVTVTNARGYNYVYQMDDNMRVSLTTDPKSHVSTETWSANNDPDTYTSSLSAVRSMTWTDGVLNSVTNSESDVGSGDTTTNFAYGTTHNASPWQPYQPESVTDPQGNATAYQYDANGNADKTTNTGTSQSTTMVINGTVNSSGSTGSCTNAKVGSVCTMTDGNSKTTTYAYDSTGRVNLVTPPASSHPSPAIGTTAVTYDADSRTATVTDGKAQVTRYTYDKRDRVTEILYQPATACSSSTTCTTYAYDWMGNLTQRVDNTGTVTFTYDAFSRPTGKTFPGGAITAAATYDANSNLATITENGYTTTYTWDTDDTLQKLAEPGGSCTGTVTLCTTFGYDNDRRRTSITFANGTVTTYTLGQSGRPLEVKTVKTSGAVTHSDLTYSYIQTGGSAPTELTQKRTDVLAAPDIVTTYHSDAYNRVTQAYTEQLTTPTPTLVSDYQYSYDAAGNMLSSTAGGTTTNYAYDAQNRLCKIAGTTCPTSAYPVTYDANGNMLTGDGHTLVYNAKNQTTSEDTISNTYADADQTERTAHGTTTFTNWLLGVGTSTVSGTKRHYVRTPDGQLIATATSSNRNYYIHDGQQNIIGLTNTSGNVTATYTYDPYGGHATATGADAANNFFRYKGGYTDTDSVGGVNGLVKFGARYYDPTIGRWTQPDPIPSANNYTYGDGNPIDRWDPSGRFDCDGWDCAVGVLEVVGGSLAIAASVPQIVACGVTIGTTCVTGVATALLGGAAIIDGMQRLY